MSKTILIAGYGPGISDAVARKFGAEGFAVALAARNEARRPVVLSRSRRRPKMKVEASD
jgi:NAD(P)-dependent dehydrogenase (short-subunit alcohol dehydrogenase family)